MKQYVQLIHQNYHFFCNSFVNLLIYQFIAKTIIFDEAVLNILGIKIRSVCPISQLDVSY